MEKKGLWIISGIILVGIIISIPILLDRTLLNTNLNPNNTITTTSQTGPTSCDTCANSYSGISVKTAFEMINNSESYPNLIILDVRTQDEYNAGHINGSILIPVTELETRINELENEKNSTIIVYCRSGNRSATASQILIDHGFLNVYNMLGGFNEWTAAGY